METPKLRVKPPPPGARCAECGSGEVSSAPWFAVGCGVAYRAFADDIACRRCGHLGPPAYVTGTNAKPSGGKETSGGRLANKTPVQKLT